MWKIFDTGCNSAENNMEFDASVMTNGQAAESSPVLHLYQFNRPSITYGYFITIAQHIDLAAVANMSIDFARRPTGGGITFHLSDFTFSIWIPRQHLFFSDNALNNYQTINEIVSNILCPVTNQATIDCLASPPKAQQKSYEAFCSAHPTHYDLMLQGKKIGGAAQRKTKQGFLHQGSIFLAPPNKEILQKIILNHQVLDAIYAQSGYLLPNNADATQIQQMHAACRSLFLSSIQHLE